MTGNDLLTHAGTTQPVNEWALDYGIYPAVILDRLARGWPTERAITMPMVTAPNQRLDHTHLPGLAALQRKGAVTGPTAQVYHHDGRSLTVQQWSAATGIKPSTMHRRLRKGWPMHMVLRTELRTRLLTSTRAQRTKTKRTPIARPEGPRRWREGVRYAHDGRNLTVTEWSAVTGLKVATINFRLRKGWPMHMVLRAHAGTQLIEHDGLRLTVPAWAKRTGIGATTIRRRLKDGWPVHDALTLGNMSGKRPGVPANFPESVGTGGGPLAQDFSEIEFSQ